MGWWAKSYFFPLHIILLCALYSVSPGKKPSVSLLVLFQSPIAKGSMSRIWCSDQLPISLCTVVECFVNTTVLVTEIFPVSVNASWIQYKNLRTWIITLLWKMSHQITGKSLVSLAGFYCSKFLCTSFPSYPLQPLPLLFLSFLPTSSFSKPWMLFILFKLGYFPFPLKHSNINESFFHILS